MHPTRNLTFCCLALVVLVALSGQAFAGTYYVALDAAHAAGCAPGFYFPSINSAINDPAVPAGSTIKVCPGTYQEQVSIRKKITLAGVATATEDAVVIVPPAGGVLQNTTDVCPALYSAFCTNGAPIAAQVLVTSGPASISNLTVDGFGNQLPVCSGTDLMGILFQNASGTVNHVAVRNQVTGDTTNGCQAGKGIYVESSTGSSIVTVENSSVHNYSKNGITGRYPGTTLTATGNYVQGSGVQPTGDAQNGIEIAFGATGTIKSNNVIDNLWWCPVASLGCGNVSAASDILLYDAEEYAGIIVNSNILGNSQIPIGLEVDTLGTYGDGVTVSGNKIFGTGAYDGIDVCTNGNTVTGNTIFNSAQSGVHLDAGCGGTGNNNTVTGNTILESACAGILDDTSGAGSNTYSPDTYFTVPFPVTYSTTGCTIPAFGGAVAHGKTTHKFSPAP